MLPSDTDTLYSILSTCYHPVQCVSAHRVDLHMQLYAVKANATILLFADVRIAVACITRAWRNLPRIRCGSTRVVPQQARCLSAYGGTLGGPRCSGREMIALHRLMLEDGLPRRGLCWGTQGTGTLFLIQAN